MLQDSHPIISRRGSAVHIKRLPMCVAFSIPKVKGRRSHNALQMPSPLRPGSGRGCRGDAVSFIWGLMGMWVSANRIWLLPTCALGSRWSVAARGRGTLASESALRRDLLPRLTAVIYRTELAVTDESAGLEKLPHLSLSRPLKERRG